MSKQKVLILGAGAAGSVVANKLAREFRRDISRDKLEITILDRNDVNINQGGFTFLPFGLYTPDDITRPRRMLISPRVKAVFGEDGEVKRVDLKKKEVTVKSGKTYAYDYLVIATGCRADVDQIPGLSKDFNSFYTSIDDALRLGEKLKNFDKGKVVILTARMPIPCPGAPGKFTVLLDAYLRYIRGEDIRKDVEITYLLPIELIGPPAYNAIISSVFEERDIELIRKFVVDEVNAGQKEVVSVDGEKIEYDLLVTIPPYTNTKAMLDSGITDENGWIPVDKHTLQYKRGSESYEEVYALGDTGPAEILKTGIGAHYQAYIVAQNLINEIRGNGSKVSYLGETGCPFVGSRYTSRTRGEAYIATWNYEKPLEPFKATELGWFLYRMYYYIYWDGAIKAVM